MSRRDRLCDLEVRVLRKSEKALLVQDSATGREAWVPLSQCEFQCGEEEDVGTLTLPEWLAEAKELA